MIKQSDINLTLNKLDMTIQPLNTRYEGKCYMIYSDTPFPLADDEIYITINLKLPEGVNESFQVYFKGDNYNMAKLALGEEPLHRYIISPKSCYSFIIR